MRKTIREENPKIAAEWDYDNNLGLDPDKFTGGSNKIVWWKCALGHNWQARITKRFTRGQNCPYCSGNKVWPGFNDIKTTHPHIAKEWDYEKNSTLRPEQFSIGADVKLWWKCEKCNHNWNAVLYSRKNCGCPACAGNILKPGINDLQTVNPQLALEWDAERNDADTPDNVAANNNKKAWWKCERGHCWQASISSRNNGRGCPYCTNKKLLPGFNDLLTVAPELAIEWHCEKNGDLRPENILAGSHKFAWWMCSRGHEWQAKISQRRMGSGCPYDAGKLVIVGETDLKTRYPDLCKEWDSDKNGQSTPDVIACHSHKLYWWVCPKGHSYRSATTNRIRGNGCPYCSGKLPIVGETDFGTIHPELICEWDFEKNTLYPEHVVAGSHKKVFWRCKEGHSWKTAVYNRHAGNNCPHCGKLQDKHIVIVGENDFMTVHPDIAGEWDNERNGDLRPQDVLPNSNRIVWWVCERGHHWKTKVQDRVKGTICPRCKGKTPMRTRLIQ